MICDTQIQCDNLTKICQNIYLKQHKESSVNLHNAIDMFIQHCNVERGLSNLTISAYKIDLKQFKEAQNELNDNSVCNITKQHIRTYLSKLGTMYKPRSIRRKLATLKSFFTFLENEEIITINPFQ